MPEKVSVTLSSEQVEALKANAIEQQAKLLKALKALETIPADNVAGCYVRHALFNLASMLHQVNLAEGTCK